MKRRNENYEKNDNDIYTHRTFVTEKLNKNLLKNTSLKYNVTTLNFLLNFAMDDRGSLQKNKEIKIFIESPKTRLSFVYAQFHSSVFRLTSGSNVDRDCIANINQFSDVPIFAVWLTQFRSSGSEPTRATFTSSARRGTNFRGIHLPSDTSATKLTVRPHAHTNCCRIISSALALGSGQRKLLRGYRNVPMVLPQEHDKVRTIFDRKMHRLVT